MTIENISIIATDRLAHTCSLGREAHHETSKLSLEKVTETQLHLNLAHHEAASERDLGNASGSSNGTTPASAEVLPEVITYPEGGLQAWLVVLGSFSGMLAAFGQMN
ncbi:MAG: hypothetical protein Q9193_005411, partial [Seirophora villosa]